MVDSLDVKGDRKINCCNITDRSTSNSHCICKVKGGDSRASEMVDMFSIQPCSFVKL
jgi:hypothetical protein